MANRVTPDQLPLIAEVWGLPYWRVLQAWSYVYVRREMCGTKGPIPILSWSRLEARVGRHQDDRTLRAAMGMAAANLYRLRRKRFLPLRDGERYCEKLGLHPAQVWGDWYAAAAAILYPVDLAEVLAEDARRVAGPGCELVAAWVTVESMRRWKEKCAA